MENEKDFVNRVEAELEVLREIFIFPKYRKLHEDARRMVKIIRQLDSGGTLRGKCGHCGRAVHMIREKLYD